MRLYPPIWGVVRQVVDDDEIGGFRIPRGSMIGLLPFVTHRHPGVWPEPDKFDPERFASAQQAHPKRRVLPVSRRASPVHRQ
jgi:cytochrome P450